MRRQLPTTAPSSWGAIADPAGADTIAAVRVAEARRYRARKQV
jgi:hypothetical protein